MEHILFIVKKSSDPCLRKGCLGRALPGGPCQFSCQMSKVTSVYQTFCRLIFPVWMWRSAEILSLNLIACFRLIKPKRSLETLVLTVKFTTGGEE